MTPTQNPVARRGFLKTTGVAALAAAAVAFTSNQARAVTPPLTFADIPGEGDIKVLNYALALEALETDLYAKALMRLTNGGRTPLGTRINGLGVSRSAPDVVYVREFGKVEREHRNFLIEELGNASILKSNAFKNARFDFNTNSLNRRQVLELIFTAERTGVGAYLGAIPFFETRTYLRAAGAIQGTEARHTAVIAAVLSDLYDPDIAVAPSATMNNGIDTPITPDVVLRAISPFIVLN